MNRITAEDCRQLVEESKIENIYQKISTKAYAGYLSLTVPFISEECFKILIKDGFTIITLDGTVELTKYDQETVFQAKEFEIVWGKV